MVSEGIVPPEHDYEDYLSKINLIDEARKYYDESELYEIVAKLIKEEYPESLPNKNTSKTLHERAKNIVKSDRKAAQYSRRHQYPDNLSGWIVEAVELGHVKKIRFKQPWHPAIFFSENHLTTFPHQHKLAIFYHGDSRHIFYSQESKLNELNQSNTREIKDGGYMESEQDFAADLHNPYSILVQGGIYVSDTASRRGKGRTTSHTGNDEIALYMGDLGRASGYNKGLVLEIACPTNNLVGENDKNYSEYRVESIEDWFKFYDSPRSWRKECGDRLRNPEDFKFTAENLDKRSRMLPLEYINGVYDDSKAGMSRGRHFVPLKDYVKLLYKDENEREKMPNPDKIVLNFSRKESQHFKREFEMDSLKHDDKVTSASFILNLLKNKFESVAKAEIDDLQGVIETKKTYTSSNTVAEGVLLELIKSVESFLGSHDALLEFIKKHIEEASGFDDNIVKYRKKDVLSAEIVSNYDELANYDESEAESIEELYIRFQQYVDRGNKEEALEVFEEAMEILSNSTFYRLKDEDHQSLLELLIRESELSEKDLREAYDDVKKEIPELKKKYRKKRQIAEA